MSVVSPWSKEAIGRVVHKSYSALSASVVKSPQTAEKILQEFVIKIKKEIIEICSKTNDSILRDSNEAVQHFSWETIWLELCSKMPTLVELLSNLVSNHMESKPLICLMASMILKDRVGLVQRAVSVLLYGNGANKQVSIVHVAIL